MISISTAHRWRVSREKMSFFFNVDHPSSKPAGAVRQPRRCRSVKSETGWWESVRAGIVWWGRIGIERAAGVHVAHPNRSLAHSGFCHFLAKQLLLRWNASCIRKVDDSVATRGPKAGRAMVREPAQSGQDLKSARPVSREPPRGEVTVMAAIIFLMLPLVVMLILGVMAWAVLEVAMAGPHPAHGTLATARRWRPPLAQGTRCWPGRPRRRRGACGVWPVRRVAKPPGN